MKDCKKSTCGGWVIAMISKPVTTELESRCLNRIRAAEAASQSHSDKYLQIQLIWIKIIVKIIKRVFEVLFKDRRLYEDTRKAKAMINFLLRSLLCPLDS